jgi:hypothetical protein
MARGPFALNCLATDGAKGSIFSQLALASQNVTAKEPIAPGQDQSGADDSATGLMRPV